MIANELRLNNWVNFKFSDLNSNVMICHNDLRNFERNIKIGEFNNIYKPIPLTEEWLVKFGFEEALNGWWSDDELWSYENKKFYLGASTYLANITYVHQLQNLYFALTGEELIAKIHNTKKQTNE